MQGGEVCELSHPSPGAAFEIGEFGPSLDVVVVVLEDGRLTDSGCESVSPAEGVVGLGRRTSYGTRSMQLTGDPRRSRGMVRW